MSSVPAVSNPPVEGVSVTIPCLNAAKYLRACLESVLAQNYTGAIEVIVGDDGSTDGSQEIAESFGPPVHLVPCPAGARHGPSAARNRCIGGSTLPLLAFLDSDDVWMPGHLRALSDALTSHPPAGLAYDNGCYMSEAGRISPGSPVLPQPHKPVVTPDDLLLSCQYFMDGVMVRRSVLDRVGLFDENLRYQEDHDLWLRIVELYPALYVPFDGFGYRVHVNQSSLHPGMWPAADTVLAKAVKRYPYKSRSVRKRRAVLAYHHYEDARFKRRPFRACWHLARAAALDPPRALSTLWALCRGIGRRMKCR